MNNKKTEALGIQSLMNEISDWSDKTFSDGVFTHQRALPITYHLKKEVDELIESLQEAGSNVENGILFEKAKEEYADCFMLLLDSAKHFGLSANDLYYACVWKLEVNKRRKWGAPDKNGVVEHIRQNSDQTLKK